MKVALITGGSRGIGAETVKKFAQEGYSVILNYNNSVDQAKQLQSQLVAEGCDVHLYKADVSNNEQVQQMFEWVQKYFKHLDALVNNAGVWRGGLVQDVSEMDYDLVMDVNAKGSFLCCKYALPLLKVSQNSGIVNVSSIWGLCGASCESIYAMSKFAQVGLTLSLAEELQGCVKVNCVCPPIVLTDMCKNYTQEEIDDFCQMHNKSCYTPTQVAHQIFALATGDASGKILEL